MQRSHAFVRLYVVARHDWDTAETAAARFAKKHSLPDKLQRKLVRLLNVKMEEAAASQAV